MSRHPLTFITEYHQLNCDNYMQQRDTVQTAEHFSCDTNQTALYEVIITQRISSDVQHSAVRARKEACWGILTKHSATLHLAGRVSQHSQQHVNEATETMSYHYSAVCSTDTTRQNTQCHSALSVDTVYQSISFIQVSQPFCVVFAVACGRYKFSRISSSTGVVSNVLSKLVGSSGV